MHGEESRIERELKALYGESCFIGKSEFSMSEAISLPEKDFLDNLTIR